MTNKQLKNILNTYPDDLEVLVSAYDDYTGTEYFEPSISVNKAFNKLMLCELSFKNQNTRLTSPTGVDI